jgi:hypothetical protein
MIYLPTKWGNPLEHLAQALGQRLLRPDPALTHARLDRIASDPGPLCITTMLEATAAC